MVSQAPYVQRLDGLDKSSPRFPDQLATLLGEKESRDHISSLPDHDAAWLVDYLDDVCTLHVACQPHFLKLAKGSRYSCSRQRCFSGVPACTQMDVW